MRKPLFKLAIILFLFCFVLLNAENALASFGVSPPFVTNNKLSKGAVFEQEVIIVRSDPVDDLLAKITYDLPDKVQKWITIDRADKDGNFILPTGETQTKIIIKVEVPRRAKLGNYTGAIYLNTEQVDLSEGVVNIAMGVQIDVNLDIVDIKIFDFVIRGVKTPDVEEGHKFLFWDIPTKIKATINYQNLGNIKSHPSKAVLAIYDNQGEVIERLEIDKGMDKVKPFSTEELDILFKTDLPAGSYKAELQIWKDEEVRFQGEVAISILPYGTLEKEGLSWFWKIFLILLFLGAIGGALYWFKFRKEKHTL